MRVGSGNTSNKLWPSLNSNLSHAIELVRRAVYFEHLSVVGYAVNGDRQAGGTLLYCDWPEELVAVYQQDGWAEHDPVAATLVSKRSTIQPDDIQAVVRDDQKGSEFVRLLRTFGVPLPTVVPVFHLQEISGAVAFARHKPFSPGELQFFALIAPPLHKEFAGDLRADLGGARLTRREVECLRYASTGMTSEEIALVMPLAAATVTAQIRSAAAKLGAANRVSAIAEAIRRGIIE